MLPWFTLVGILPTSCYIVVHSTFLIRSWFNSLFWRTWTDMHTWTHWEDGPPRDRFLDLFPRLPSLFWVVGLVWGHSASFFLPAPWKTYGMVVLPIVSFCDLDFFLHVALPRDAWHWHFLSFCLSDTFSHSACLLYTHFLCIFFPYPIICWRNFTRLQIVRSPCFSYSPLDSVSHLKNMHHTRVSDNKPFVPDYVSVFLHFWWFWRGTIQFRFLC